MLGSRYLDLHPQASFSMFCLRITLFAKESRSRMVVQSLIRPIFWIDVQCLLFLFSGTKIAFKKVLTSSMIKPPRMQDNQNQNQVPKRLLKLFFLSLLPFGGEKKRVDQNEIKCMEITPGRLRIHCGLLPPGLQPCLSFPILPYTTAHTSSVSDVFATIPSPPILSRGFSLVSLL